ncbi:thiamine pyrophosphate-binding protein, partial [Hydrogenovibrio marinus]
MNKIRVADYIANYLYEVLGIEHVFLVTGGGAMFLNDGVAKHGKLIPICNHHEQASAMAAVGYAKYQNSYAAVMTTSGCGATNAVTGVLDAWQDNTSVFFISGQVKRKETVYNSEHNVRQVGVQEANIVPIVESITKYSVMINDPTEIAYHLEKAAFLAKNGRPGPVWLDIPQDVQGAMVELDKLKHFDVSRECAEHFAHAEVEVEAFYEVLMNSKRPIILAGNGVRLADAVPEFNEMVLKYQIPVVTTYLAIDLLSNSALNIGRVGIKGDRAGNFALQNSDLVVVLGSRLSVAVTGFEYDLFARDAQKYVVDIDKEEHMKNTVQIDEFIHMDVKKFLLTLNGFAHAKLAIDGWRDKCIHWKEKWPVASSSYEINSAPVNLYTSIKYLEKYLKKDTAVVADAGSAYYVTAQALQVNYQQRYITSGAQADMGFSIPAAIGVSVAKAGEVVAITGDGSFQMNIQELQTIVQHKLPVKLLIWNNNGYLSIRTTQNKFFDGRLMGTEYETGISFPEVEKIAKAYGISFYKVETLSVLDSVLKQVMSADGPVICEIIAPPDQEIIPTVSSIRRDDG